MTLSKSSSQTESERPQSSTGATLPVASADSDGSQRKTYEIGGPKGPEPTRYGDWEKKGRCSDF